MENLQLEKLLENQSEFGLKFNEAFTNIHPRPAITETFRPCCIGHTFSKYDYPIPGMPVKYIVQDFLVDSTGLSKGGEKMEDLVQIGLNDSITVQYKILPSICKNKFEIKLPDSVSKGFFSIELGRQSISQITGGYYDQYPAQIIFGGLVGTQPVLSYNSFFIVNGKNDAINFVIQGEFASNFSFDSILIKGNYPARNFLPNIGWYKPLSYAAPIGLPTGESSCFVMFGYMNPPRNTNDLGSIVKIV